MSSDPFECPLARLLAALCIAVASWTSALAADGGYDPEFADGGRRLFSVSAAVDELVGMAQRPNRKIVLAGGCSAFDSSGGAVASFCAAELSASGAGTDFGTAPGIHGPGRFVSTDLRAQAPGEDLVAYAAAVDGNGRLLIAGQRRTATTEAALLRIAANGHSIDPLYLRPNAAGESAVLFADVSVDSAQRILLAGFVLRNGSVRSGLIMRLLPNLQPDSAFGSAGTVFLEVPDYNVLSARIRSDGQNRILVLSNLSRPGFSNIVRVDRLTPSGQADLGFGNAGRAEVSGFNLYFAPAMAIDGNNRVLVLGQYADPIDNDRDLLLLRLSNTGNPDPSIASQGLGTGLRAYQLEDLVAVGPNEAAGNLLVQPDGRIVIVGFCQKLGSDQRSFLTMRTLDDGSLDTDYGLGGVSVGSFQGAPATGFDDSAVALAFDPVGGLLVAGTGIGSAPLANDDFGIARLRNAAVAGDFLFADGVE